MRMKMSKAYLSSIDTIELVEALNGRVTDHHRFLLRLHLNDIAFLAEQIEEIDGQIQRCMIPFRKEETLIQTIPGIRKTTASAIIAEIGVDMSQFPSDAHLANTIQNRNH
jgi:transposase